MRTVYFTVILFLAIFSNTVAQTEKGRWLVGAQVGDLAYRKMKNDLGHNFTISLTPSVGYFLVKNLSLGIVVPVTVNKLNLEYSPSYFSRSVGIGPSLQYFIGNASVKPFVGIGYTYNWNYTKWSDANPANESVSKGYDDTLTPSAGVAFFFNRNVLLSAGLGYNIQHRNSETRYPGRPNTVTSDFSDRFNSLSLGIRFAVLFGQ